MQRYIIDEDTFYDIIDVLMKVYRGEQSNNDKEQAVNLINRMTGKYVVKVEYE